MQDGQGAQELDAAWVVAWIRAAAQAVSEHRVELITLDRAIGDGDHGENMDRGFQAVVAKLDAAAELATPAEVLKLVATTLISTVGGASGPLFGTAFLKASGAVTGQESLDGAAVAALLAAAVINRLFAGTLALDRPLCLITPDLAAGAAGLTLAGAVLVAAIAGTRAARVEPWEGVSTP